MKYLTYSDKLIIKIQKISAIQRDKNRIFFTLDNGTDIMQQFNSEEDASVFMGIIEKHLAQNKSECEWREDRIGVWRTGCGRTWSSDYDPEIITAQIKYCHWCGGETHYLYYNQEREE